MTHRGLWALAEACPELQHVNIGGWLCCAALCCPCMREACPELQHISIGGWLCCDALCCPCMLEACPEPQHVNIGSGCAVLCCTVLEACPELQHVNIGELDVLCCAVLRCTVRLALLPQLPSWCRPCLVYSPPCPFHCPAPIHPYPTHPHQTSLAHVPSPPHLPHPKPH